MSTMSTRRCAEYERRIEELERQLAVWQQWEAAVLLLDTRKQIRARTASSRVQRALPPVPDPSQEAVQERQEA